MTNDEALANLRDQARAVIDACMNEIDRRVALAGQSGREDPTNEHDRSSLAILLIGLMDRAQRRGIPWNRITDDAAITMREISKLPASPLVQ